VDRNADGVADAGGEDASVPAAGIVLQDVRAAGFRSAWLFVDVADRAHGDVELLAVPREGEVARPVAAAPQAAAAREVIDDPLRLVARLQVSVAIGEAHH
jgi:hypothetical protein